MGMTGSILAQFEHECATTRRFLERVPDAKLAWAPHPRSMTLGALASHLAEIPGWAVATMAATELDLAPPGGPSYVPPLHQTRDAALQSFDGHMTAARKAIASATESDWSALWSLKVGGAVQFTLPRVAVLRGFVLSHQIHHRGQLSVYLRLLDVPVPSAYGPSADEGTM